MSIRHYSAADILLINFDQGMRTIFGSSLTPVRPSPIAISEQPDLDSKEQRRSARLMRVNHTGEVCAQALYHGQAFTARHNKVRERMSQAAAEESDHLAWCEARIDALGSHTSVLNPLFYFGSFCIGGLAGKIGDRWSLGFAAETEYQVVHHLEKHLQKLPAEDHHSRAILERMKEDEQQHATQALAAGGAKLPWPVRLVMKATSKIMTKTTYWI